MNLHDPFGRTIIIADSFCEPTAPHEEQDPVRHFVDEITALSDELKATTATPEACDQWLEDSCKLFSAAIEINLACHRIRARFKDRRVPDRMAALGVAAE